MRVSSLLIIVKMSHISRRVLFILNLIERAGGWRLGSRAQWTAYYGLAENQRALALF